MTPSEVSPSGTASRVPESDDSSVHNGKAPSCADYRLDDVDCMPLMMQDLAPELDGTEPRRSLMFLKSLLDFSLCPPGRLNENDYHSHLDARIDPGNFVLCLGGVRGGTGDMESRGVIASSLFDDFCFSVMFAGPDFLVGFVRSVDAMATVSSLRSSLWLSLTSRDPRRWIPADGGFPSVVSHVDILPVVVPCYESNVNSGVSGLPDLTRVVGVMCNFYHVFVSRHRPRSAWFAPDGASSAGVSPSDAPSAAVPSSVPSSVAAPAFHPSCGWVFVHADTHSRRFPPPVVDENGLSVCAPAGNPRVFETEPSVHGASVDPRFLCDMLSVAARYMLYVYGDSAVC